MNCLDLRRCRAALRRHRAEGGAGGLVISQLARHRFPALDGHLARSARTRVIPLRTRGHGAVDLYPAPTTMGARSRDADGRRRRSGVRDCVFARCRSGQIAQGLGPSGMDLVRAWCISTPAPQVGHARMWAGAHRHRRGRGHGTPWPTRSCSAGFPRGSAKARRSRPGGAWSRPRRAPATRGVRRRSRARISTPPTAALRLPAAGHRGVGGRIDTADLVRDLARADPRRALRADPGCGPPALRGKARGLRPLLAGVPARHRARPGMSASPFDSGLYRGCSAMRSWRGFFPTPPKSGR